MTEIHCRWYDGGVCTNKNAWQCEDICTGSCNLQRPPLSPREQRLSRLRRIEEARQAYIDRHVIKSGACRNCSWHTTGLPCVLPKCMMDRVKSERGGDADDL